MGTKHLVLDYDTFQVGEGLSRHFQILLFDTAACALRYCAGVIG